METNTNELLLTYLSTYEKIKETIKDLNEEEKNLKPSADKWSVKEIINHLCDSEIMAVTRLFRIATEANPTLPTYNQNVWASTLNYNNLDEELALLIFGLIRTRMYQILQFLPKEAWERKGTHSERGEVTFYDMFKLYTEHGESHLKQIQETLKNIKNR